MNTRLSETQRRIVQHNDGSLLVVAGPGSGKTRVLTERIRRLLNESKGHFRILALTFTNKAANEMKERLAEFPDINQRAFIGTLHSFCMEVLANRGKSVGINKLPNIFESHQDCKQVLLQAVLHDPEYPELRHELKSVGGAKKQEKLLSSWLEIIGRAKNDLLFPEMIDNEIERKVYWAYNDGLRASDAVDFGDLLLLTYRLLQERPRIADFYRRQYRYICIDEAQDLNKAQYQVIRVLCGPGYRNVMMVGEPKQAIFGWNGADPKYLDQFEQDFGAEKIFMNENFRSSQAVVKAAKALDPEYEVEGQLPIPGSIKLIVGEDEQREAVCVLNYIQDLVDNGHQDIEGNITWDRCALLGRTRYVLSAVEQELKTRQLPHYTQLSAPHESESDLLQDFELCLRLLANPLDRLHLEMLLKRWDLRKEDISLLSSNGLDLLAALKKKVSGKDHEAVLFAIEELEWSGLEFKFRKAMDCLDSFAESKENQEERALILKDIKTWREHWKSFSRSQPGGRHSLTSFLGQVALGTTQQPRQDGLALLTVHSAKGLEFDVVVVMGMAEGTFPDYRARGAALQEEKRNAFVAVTRSKRLLCLSYPKTKVMPWGAVWRQKPSPYLKILGLTEGFQ
ncbi:MAG: ATP-dependent DNA helicase Rep [Candidatus Methanogaster sp.]|nr:MAG: ATP-dependent DNA helicase Rep [ANME-2 cluster archaeon]